MLISRPTPTSRKPQIKINTKRRIVLAFDLLPLSRFFWKIRENDKAMLTAKTAFINEAASIISVAIGEAVRYATVIAWLMTEPITM